MRTPLIRRILFAVVVALLALSVPAQVFAQRGVAVPRHVAAPVHPGVSVGVGGHYGYGYGWGVGVGFGFAWYPFYNPWYYGYGYPYHFGFGWYPPYPYYAPFYPYYPYYGYSGYAIAEIRIAVKQRDAEVYVDGYLAGNVDQFDGTFQRLRVRPGEHDIVLYRDGMKTVQQHLYAGPGSDLKVQVAMEPLAPGETSGPRPTPPPPAERDKANDSEQERQPRESWPRTQPPPTRGEKYIEAQPAEPTTSSFGSIALLIQPADAEIFVDGIAWKMAAGESRLSIRLPEGRHKVEVRKAGFATYTEEVAVQRSRTLTLNVSLIRN